MSRAINTSDGQTVPHPNVEDSRVKMYLNLGATEPRHVNSPEEAALKALWHAKFVIAEGEYLKSRCNPENLKIWRDAFEGNVNALDEEGKPTTIRLRTLRKMAFEGVESKVNPHIPAPKMMPRSWADLQPIRATERLIRHEIKKMCNEETHDEAEHAVAIDGFTWYKVSWNPFDSVHERSGMPLVEVCPVDTVFPQPGVTKYKQLEYIFQRTKISIAKVWDLYRRMPQVPSTSDMVDVIEVYYLNQDRHVARFAWAFNCGTVLANDLEWGMRCRRECKACGRVENVEMTCHTCGKKEFHNVPVKQMKLSEDLVMVNNPYREGQTGDPEADEAQTGEVIPEGTVIPHYLIRQLPFVPRRSIKLTGTIYGISEVEKILENQDMVNKLLNKAGAKSAASKTYITKLKDTRIDDQGKEISFVEVESPAEGQSIQVKQAMSDITGEITMAETLYQHGITNVGVTDTDQGRHDPSARSGKAKQMQILASQQRRQAPGVLRDAAMAGVYELIFKYLLAFSDETRRFVAYLPDGTEKQEEWSKFMFLEQDDDGEWFWRDDFAWTVDTATEITQDRASMWQLITNDYVNGTMGNEIDPIRALHMYWNMMDQNQYPTAPFALAFLRESVKRLPSQIEALLAQNPEAVQLALSFIEQMNDEGGLGGRQQGGAREGAGRPGNNSTQQQQVARNHTAERTAAGNENDIENVAQGGMQGGNT